MMTCQMETDYRSSLWTTDGMARSLGNKSPRLLMNYQIEDKCEGGTKREKNSNEIKK